jgi:hypothetical protein
MIILERSVLWIRSEFHNCSLNRNTEVSSRSNCESEKKMLFGHLYLVFIALTIGFPISLIAQTIPQKSNPITSFSHVPFVGCESVGDDGEQPLPEGESKEVGLDGKDSGRLAYYESQRSAGVLAPRGWHGFGTYGLWGSRIIVTRNPLKIDASEVDAEAAACIKVSRYDGLRLFGRWWVADVIARVFPTQREYIKSVISDIHPASVIPTGPYPNDKLVYRSDLVIEFRTPPHRKGLGELTPNDQPISGVAILDLEGEDPTVSLLTVRFMPHNDHLASQIIQQFERDESAPTASVPTVTASSRVANDKEDARTPKEKQADLDQFDRVMPGKIRQNNLEAAPGKEDTRTPEQKRADLDQFDSDMQGIH